MLTSRNFDRAINERLVELDTDCCEQQIHCFPWLYGALGNPESEVVFICENPSLAGVEDAHKNTVDGGPPGIEDQWWGGLAKRFRAKRFRAVLCELGLKDGKIDERVGWRGWHCYITNVVKEMNKTKDQNAMQQRAKGPASERLGGYSQMAACDGKPQGGLLHRRKVRRCSPETPTRRTPPEIPLPQGHALFGAGQRRESDRSDAGGDIRTSSGNRVETNKIVEKAAAVQVDDR